jgi:beta-N-acetylhexosaminidase
MRASRVCATLALGLVVVVSVSACAGSTGPGMQHPSVHASHRRKPPPDPIAGMTLAEQVGQLFMVGTTAASAEGITLDSISDLHVGNVFLSGRSHAGVVATAAIVEQFRARVTAAATARQPLLVATDQEGGEVQVLQGPGFDAMPTGVAQSGMSADEIQIASTRWGAELAAAGVNMDLAPVVDLVDSRGAAPANPPIGLFQREIGFTPDSIEAHADAFRGGMATSDVVTVLKHFPGLGHVSENTDTSRGVVDSSVTTKGPDVGIYRAEIAAGAPCIMVSSAVYANLDPTAPAIFSSKVVTGLLRTTLGFKGVIVSDDLSAAAQIEGYSPADRAIDAISAGDDIVLISSNPSLAPTMVDAVLAKAEADPAFAAQVAKAARAVVELKHKYLGRDYPNGNADPSRSNLESAIPFL